MRTKPLVIITLMAILFSSCWSYWDDYRVESAYRPVLMLRSDLESSIKVQEPKSIEKYGKIYRKDSLLFINEPYEGIHIYDNSDPQNPENLGFINIPGNIDIAMKGDILYADNAVDLVTMRLNADHSITILDRNRDVFPESSPPDGEWYYFEGENQRPENSVIVKWVEK